MAHYDVYFAGLPSPTESDEPPVLDIGSRRR